MILKHPNHVYHILTALGVDSDAEYQFDGTSLTIPSFTDAQISDAESRLDIPALDKAELNATADIKRREAYPEIGDQLDAIWKQIAKLKADGIVIDVDADSELSKIIAIKKKYKKEK